MWDHNKNRQIVAAHSPDGIDWHIYDELPSVGATGHTAGPGARGQGRAGARA